jgi:hypothetical protein
MTLVETIKEKDEARVTSLEEGGTVAEQRVPWVRCFLWKPYGALARLAKAYFEHKRQKQGGKLMSGRYSVRLRFPYVWVDSDSSVPIYDKDLLTLLNLMRSFVYLEVCRTRRNGQRGHFGIYSSYGL